jgi:subtilisin family serine protease
MRKYHLIFIAFFVLSCKKDVVDVVASKNEIVCYTQQELDQIILRELRQTSHFDWHAQPMQVVWSALMLSDQMLSIGFAPSASFFKREKIHMVDLNQPEWTTTKNAVIESVLESERKLFSNITLDSIMPWTEDVLPLINIRIRNVNTLEMLKKRSDVRYIEPMGYEPYHDNLMKGKIGFDEHLVQSSSGCGSNQFSDQLSSPNDYLVISPSAKQSWNMNVHGIPSAWLRSAGRGVKIFLIDTGVSDEQENLSTGFSQGASIGRMIEKRVTLPRSVFLGIPTGPVETVDDDCGHGTSMAGVCVAPRGSDGAVCGVAYQSDLISCRAAVDVYLDESRETKGVSDAFVMAGNRTDVKIVSMSMGRLTGSNQIRDAIYFAQGKGKLIFCAAGTSLSWTSGWTGVIFPASMDQVNAVTGVYASNVNLSCSNCHDGPETDFTIVMQKTGTTEFPLTLADRGDIPSTVGGSSVATATAAGIAALVWSRYPTWNAAMVRERMIQSSMNYPIRHAQLGWGLLNAEKATR